MWVQTLPPSTQYNYLMRIISPEQKTKFITKVWHDVHEKCLSTPQLEQKLISTFEEKLPPLSELQCGYFEKRATGKRWVGDKAWLPTLSKPNAGHLAYDFLHTHIIIHTTPQLIVN